MCGPQHRKCYTSNDKDYWGDGRKGNNYMFVSEMAEPLGQKVLPMQLIFVYIGKKVPQFIGDKLYTFAACSRGVVHMILLSTQLKFLTSWPNTKLLWRKAWNSIFEMK